jgi:general secretion pathway protein L
MSLTGRELEGDSMPQARKVHMTLQASAGRFWSWWNGELKQCVPRNALRYFIPEAPELVIAMEGSLASFSLKDGTDHRPIRTIDLDEAEQDSGDEQDEAGLADLPRDNPAIVFPPADKILRQEIMLPLATEQNLDAVIRFELDRLTPFRAAEAAYGYRVLGRYPEVEKIRVELVVSEQTSIDRLVKKLGALGFKISGVYPPPAGGEHDFHATLNMLAREQRPDKKEWLDRRARNTALVAAVLLFLVFAFPIWQLNRAEKMLQKKIDTIQKEATVVGEKRAILNARLGAQNQLLNRKSQVPGKLQIVQELTHLFPDNTWVAKLSLAGVTVGVAGESDKASDLIELMDESPLFQNVRFDSPVTRNPKSNRDRYEIRMELVTPR